MSTQIVVNPVVKNIINLLNEAIANSPTGVSIFSIRNYESGLNDKKTLVTKIADYRINVGISYEKQKQKDIVRLQNLDVTTLTGFKSSSAMLLKAKEELINSFIKPNENRSNGQLDAYTTIRNGVKVHNETGKLYIYGYKLNETVIRKGDKIPTKHSELTIAKMELQTLLKTSKFVNFSISVGNTLRANGRTIEL